MKLGILALQGDFEAHGKVLERLGVTYHFVTEVKHLFSIDGLIIPGGESTTMLKLLREEGLFEPIKEFVRERGYVLGTCAGAILLANQVTDPEQASLQLIDIGIERNAYGRQLGSHIGFGELNFPGSEVKDFEMVFIRAPKIVRVGEEVTVFANHKGQPVGAMSGRTFVTTFHPELTQNDAVHQFFVAAVSSK